MDSNWDRTANLTEAGWIIRTVLDTMGDLIDVAADADRAIAPVMAARAAHIDAARQWSQVCALSATPDTFPVKPWTAERVARRELIAELGAALRLPDRTIELLIDESEALMHQLPLTLAALQSGQISYRHAQSMIDHAGSLPADAQAGFEETALPFATGLTAAKFDRKARILRERLHPDTIQLRHRLAAEGRETVLQPGRDGMAWLTTHLTAVHAQAVYSRLTDIALSLQGPDEHRTLTQLRTDVLTDLLTDGVIDNVIDNVDVPSGAGDEVDGSPRPSTKCASRGPIGRGIRARVFITVPVLTLLDHGDEPATLEGYGPIDLDTARELMADAPGFTRILTHPETGTVLSVGRDRYGIPNDLRTWLRIRDETCRKPGCNTSARRCELDHTVDWHFDGVTAYNNLAHLCPKHHDEKHHTKWTMSQSGGERGSDTAGDPTHGDDGIIHWVSPTGHHYSTHPATHIGKGNLPQRE